MGRPLRQAAGGIAYHVLNRRVLKLPLFEDDADYLAFIRVLSEATQRPDAPQLLAFCLMPNHWHLLLRPRRNGDLPRWMQWLTVTHTHRWHAHHHTAGTGPVYQGRFKSFPVQTDLHFLTVARYVERNPLRSNLCRQAQQWRWSSLALSQRGKFTKEEQQLRQALTAWPVSKPRNWVQRVNRVETSAELKAMRHSVQRGTPFGSPTWITRTANRLDLQTTLRPRGRPRKKP